ncbi:MAG: hypothetical protein MOGMAGMI_02325 [Candidatus Omnitrophica bacterium]|nr:hypothetical protein [Candidatus Omnitrophota bacterium]
MTSRKYTPKSLGFTVDKDADGGEYIRCHRCGRASYNPNDVKFKYCGFCHVYHEAQGPKTAIEPRKASYR